MELHRALNLSYLEAEQKSPNATLWTLPAAMSRTTVSPWPQSTKQFQEDTIIDGIKSQRLKRTNKVGPALSLFHQPKQSNAEAWLKWIKIIQIVKKKKKSLSTGQASCMKNSVFTFPFLAEMRVCMSHICTVVLNNLSCSGTYIATSFLRFEP